MDTATSAAEEGFVRVAVTPPGWRASKVRSSGRGAAFMQEKCGLMNPANPCRCEKKTRGFIAAGWVDPRSMKFTAAHVSRVREDVPPRAHALDVLYEERAPWLFRDHPMLDGPDIATHMTALLNDQAVRAALALAPN